jgi:hypothetical protein
MKTNIKTLVDSNKGLKFTESHRWYNGKLWFLDIHDKRIKTVDLAGSVETVQEYHEAARLVTQLAVQSLLTSYPSTSGARLCQ